MNRLDVAGSLKPSSSKTHITYTFQIEKEMDQLEILFTYSPKIMSDDIYAKEIIQKAYNDYGYKAPEDLSHTLPLKNLITLSLDGPNRFMGAGHRHSNHQRINIGATNSTPGFETGKITQGMWSITISIHAVVTKSCNYELIVREVG